MSPIKIQLLFSIPALCLIYAQAASFDIINKCSYSVWPAVIPTGRGKRLDSGETWSLKISSGTSTGRIWGRTGCNCDKNSECCTCKTGDCCGDLNCDSSGEPPTTIAEFTLNGGNNMDFFDLSVIDGFNIPMQFSSTSKGCNGSVTCYNSSCPRAYQSPNDVKTLSCPTGTDYTIIFCPLILYATPAQNSPIDYVNSHNAARSEVGVQNIIWNDTVAAYAQNYAKQRKDCQLIHSGGKYGENMAMSTGDMSGTEAVELWVNEKSNYDYNSNSCAVGDVCDHYTQVVWSNTISLGCARVTCDNGGTFVICNYDPPGNHVGQRPY